MLNFSVDMSGPVKELGRRMACMPWPDYTMEDLGRDIVICLAERRGVEASVQGYMKFYEAEYHEFAASMLRIFLVDCCNLLNKMISGSDINPTRLEFHSWTKSGQMLVTSVD